jgi:hypothetical protein
MKVPYLKEKRRTEMTALAAEFASVIAANLSTPSLKPRLHGSWLNELHSLFALLQIFLAKQHSVNPSKEYALQGSKSLEDRELFLESVNSFQASPAVLAAMRSAYSETIFTGFIAELRSDLLMVFVNGLMYGYRSAAIGLRCALEDLYRHLYYMDHPQEYVALTTGRESEHSMNLSPIKFREYLRRASYLQPFSQVNLSFESKISLQSSAVEMDFFGKNEELYSSLSAAVHGSGIDWFAAINNASALRYQEDKEKKLKSICIDFSKMCVAFLVAAHHDIVASAGDYDRSIVLEVYNLDERSNFRRLLNI